MNRRGKNYKKEFNAEEEKRRHRGHAEFLACSKLPRKTKERAGAKIRFRHASALDNCELVLLFVRGRTVEAGNWNVKQTKIDCQLAAVVNQVIHDHSAKACHARHGENFFSAGE